MARTDPQLNFRIPAELKARLEDAAEKNQRTLTGELIARLEGSFAAPLNADLEQEVVKMIDTVISDTMRRMYESGWRQVEHTSPKSKTAPKKKTT